MGIYMYDVKFGDCFQITGDLFPGGLVVDFGSLSNLSIQFDKIIDHFKMTKPGKLLLSHYHLDHLSGLLYMIKINNIYKFKEILIPDIFSTRGLRRAIVLHYLDDFLDSCVLPKRGRTQQYTLLQFATYLSASPMKVTLLKRGDQFERINQSDTCTVLWPDEKYIADYAEELLESLDIDGAVNEELNSVADITANLFTSIIELGENNYDERNQETYRVIQTRLDALFQEYDLQNQLQTHQTKLKDFGHSVNIVFHNSISGKNNFLFTGDIGKCDMEKIKKNPDNKPELDLHTAYEYIKMPHHGTEKHFCDLSGYTPGNILIPNGKSRNHPGYKITKDYANLYSNTSTMYCSNCNWCEKRKSVICTCNNKEIIYSTVKKYIP